MQENPDITDELQRAVMAKALASTAPKSEGAPVTVTPAASAPDSPAAPAPTIKPAAKPPAPLAPKPAQA